MTYGVYKIEEVASVHPANTAYPDLIGLFEYERHARSLCGAMGNDGYFLIDLSTGKVML